jgi:hypothetical protein
MLAWGNKKCAQNFEGTFFERYCMEYREIRQKIVFLELQALRMGIRVQKFRKLSTAYSCFSLSVQS